jgi:hypothetical protein
MAVHAVAAMAACNLARLALRSGYLVLCHAFKSRYCGCPTLRSSRAMVERRWVYDNDASSARDGVNP